MTRLLAAAGIALAAAMVVALCGIAQAGPAQLLSIDLSSTQPRIDRLVSYVKDLPVHVRVTAPKADRVAIEGASPDGSPVDVLLTRGTDGVFAGDLPLGVAGDWSLAADSTVGNDSALTDHFTISAVDAPPVDLPSLLIALSGASVLGGLGLLFLGRRVQSRASVTDT